MTDSIRHFYDLDLSLERNPVTDDIVKKVDTNAIKQSIRNLVELNKFDVPFHPEICGQIRSLLFENFTPITKISLERNITSVIENFEPRVTILNIDVEDEPDKNAISVVLEYKIINATVPITAKFYVYRAR